MTDNHDDFGDITIPNAVIYRLTKAAVAGDDGFAHAGVATECKTAINIVARLFIHYLTATTVEVARAKGRTKLTLADVLDALVRIDFGDLVDKTQSDVALLADAAERGKKRRADGVKAAAVKRATSDPAESSAATSSTAAANNGDGDDGDDGDDATDDRDVGEGDDGDESDDDGSGETEAKRQKMMDALLSA
uniref:Transcription factor CBF/NF-Y/archaeal histone domain-containing protein n=1 Tax=Sexangularia sp. CB-2014 TaxID=1486929 RepID=A0A7S1VCX6_9EUKA|mmetsp:Transcript_15399/g.48097  ORF Transcript_15399/g.48097 Transcript_15399/m.48097 type:complete len:192 (+) Transcript_15399:104-679(+)